MSCKPTRREFIQMTGTASALLAAGSNMEAIAGPFEPKDTADHFVPVDKKLKPEWVKKLFEKGEPTWYAGNDLKTIGMPIGGITTGQLYLAGDGRLAHWDIFNLTRRANRAYDVGPPPGLSRPAGFCRAGESRRKNGEADARRRAVFRACGFCGEYPLGFVEYKDDALPVTIALEAFSPFIPLNAADSALPVTVMQFTVKNTSSSPAEVTLAGWLENAVCSINGDVMLGARINRAVRKEGLSLIESTAKSIEPPKNAREPIVIADFEGDDYGKWKAEGKAFGDKPATGTLPGQQPVSGFQGRGLVNTFLEGRSTAREVDLAVVQDRAIFHQFSHRRRTPSAKDVHQPVGRRQSGPHEDRPGRRTTDVGLLERPRVRGTRGADRDRRSGIGSLGAYQRRSDRDGRRAANQRYKAIKKNSPISAAWPWRLLGKEDGVFFRPSLPEENLARRSVWRTIDRGRARRPKNHCKIL